MEIVFIPNSDLNTILAMLYAACLRIAFMKALTDECLLTWD